MAHRWRLRHKLLLGVTLVVASVGALLAGTIYGLDSYMQTMKTTDSKLAELLKLDELKPVAAGILSYVPNTQKGPIDLLRLSTPQEDQVTLARERLAESKRIFADYKLRFEDTNRRKRDPDPYTDTQLIPIVDKTFVDLEKAIENYAAPQGAMVSKPLSDDKEVRKQYERLLSLIDQLRSEVAGDMYARIGLARREYRQAMWIASGSAIAAGVLVLILITLFSGWVFKPIRDLQAGVERVTGQDFSQPIELKSGDELEDLATAFNGMMKRLEETYRDLEQQVEERSRQLVRSERMVSVGFLAAGVAHEINNPLASIAFCAESLETRLADYIQRDPQNTQVVAKYLKMIQQEAFRCKGITAKLLEFSRTGEQRREPTDLSELIQSVLEIAQHLQHCRGKRIVFQPFGRVIALVCGEDIKSVVLNLVVNALESMEEGGTLTITLQSKNNYAEMTFSDTGCGMTAEVLKNLFEPFYTRSRTGKGTGLGLFISHQIIDQHGGQISATSAGPQQGSTFTVRIPLQAVGTKAESKTSGGTLPIGSSKKSGKTQSEEGLGHAA